MSLYYIILQTNAAKEHTHTHNICHAGQYVYAQFSTVMQAAIHGIQPWALGLLNAAKVPGFYTGTHFAYPGGMTRLSWPGWLVKTERVR